MATVTEPFTLNASGGVAPRNGTTTHTINFGFTSTANSLLVVSAFGAVTNTVTSTGWTERLEPVSSGELSLFTKTSTGDSSISLSHNSSNYPILWNVWEFPAGSTYIAGIGSNDTNNTFPTLTGLPGVAVVVVAMRGVVIANATTTATATWNSPFTEDRDETVPGTPTDGGYITIGHTINYTGTSVTPVATVTPSQAFVNSDREQIVFAINAATIPVASSSGLFSERVTADGVTQTGYLSYIDANGVEQPLSSFTQLT